MLFEGWDDLTCPFALASTISLFAMYLKETIYLLDFKKIYKDNQHIWKQYFHPSRKIKRLILLIVGQFIRLCWNPLFTSFLLRKKVMERTCPHPCALVSPFTLPAWCLLHNLLLIDVVGSASAQVCRTVSNFPQVDDLRFINPWEA